MSIKQTRLWLAEGCRKMAYRVNLAYINAK